ncbi:AsmA family protein [Pseudoalteromonas phenolica]|uniref:AsmA family protein n=1 Tax=Pseudoalteromonas phenolica TaxID=161398 RepID=A0A5R9Q8Y6_9GAMM|nr:AsmA family protein [Pseudoalteromonas phenolica]TLX49017.1 AsmA family protein [Pseudoalteromonas phenolica]
MNRFVKVIGGVVVVAVGAVVAAPFLIPTDTIIQQVLEQVENTTGRKLTIAGESQLTVFPSLSIELNDVAFANMASGSAENMVSMEQLAVHIPWLSLLSGEAKLERFVIRNPNILLETDKQGKANWQIMPTTAAAPTAQTNEAAAGPVKLPQGFDVSLGEVAIYGGQLTYLDGVTGAKQQVSDFELIVALPSLFKPLDVKGGLTYQQQRFELNTQVDTPAKAIEGQTFDVTQTLASALLDLKFNGAIAQQGKDIKGSLKLAGDSVKAITQWQGIDLKAKDNAFNQFSVSGEMHLAGETFKLSVFEAKLDALAIKGQSQIDLGARLNVMADIDLGMLDLNPYLPESPEKPAESAQPTEPGEPQPIVWDDTPIDLSGLNALDADIKVRSTGLIAKEIKLGENQFSVNLKDGKARLGLDKFNAYEGKGQGKVVVNAKRAPYQINTDFSLTDINAEPLLTDAVGFDKVLGKGSISWALNTQGQSQKQFVSALAGNLAFSFIDGGVKGANIAEMMRKGSEMLKGDFSSLKEGLNADFDPNQKTDFSALTGTFTFKNGVGTNTDLNLASPLLRITGSGEVDLPKTYVNYRLVTGLVDTIEGQASSDDSTGFKVPLRIKGPFHKVDYKLDFGSAAKDKAKEEAKEKVKDKLKDKLKGFFG